MRPLRLPSLVATAFVALTPGLAWADPPARAPAPPASAKGEVDEASDPGDIESDANTNQRALRGAKASMSKTLGGSAKDSDSRRIENTAAGLTAPGGLIGIDSNSSGVDTPDRVQTAPPNLAVPELHVVQNGDTLWSLCSKYFGDPWRWPRLWAANPVITNPHWIFPGDVIRLGEQSGAVAPPVAADQPAVPGERRKMTSVNRVGAEGGKGVLLREVGFIEAKDLAQAATVTGSREEQVLLASGNPIYLHYPKEAPLHAGERYSVFATDTDDPIIDAETGKNYGFMVKILGDIVVNQIAENNIARGTLVDTVDPVERGARASAFVRQFKRIEPRPSKVDLEARVIATFAPNTLLGSGNFVVINRGARDGVEVGNRTFVIRRGDGYRGVLEGWERLDPNAPKEVVGEILVVDVREEASVAWIARSNRELKVGEITEMRKGH